MSEMCCVKVWHDYYFNKTCSRKGKVQVDGKWYCGQHDPNAVAKKNAERQAKWDRDMAISSAKCAKDRAVRDFADACVVTKDKFGCFTLCDETRQAFKSLLAAIDKLEEVSK